MIMKILLHGSSTNLASYHHRSESDTRNHHCAMPVDKLILKNAEILDTTCARVCMCQCLCVCKINEDSTSTKLFLLLFDKSQLPLEKITQPWLLRPSMPWISIKFPHPSRDRSGFVFDWIGRHTLFIDLQESAYNFSKLEGSSEIDSKLLQFWTLKCCSLVRTLMPEGKLRNLFPDKFNSSREDRPPK